MRNEVTFRIIFISMFVLVVSIRVYFHSRAKTFRENFLPQAERRLTATLRLLLGGPFLVAIVIYIVLPRWMAWAAWPLPFWLRWLGVGLALVTVPLLLWVHVILGQNFSPTLQVNAQHTLIQHGPYHWVRHPMYTVMFLMHIAYFLLTANWLIGGLGILVITVVMVMRTKAEEAVMLGKFGDAYRAYMEHTGQFLPRLARSSHSDNALKSRKEA